MLDLVVLSAAQVFIFHLPCLIFQTAMLTDSFLRCWSKFILEERRVMENNSYQMYKMENVWNTLDWLFY